MMVASFNDVGSHVIGGLQPFTEYEFLVEACTLVGCNRSGAESVVTLESGKSCDTYATVLILLCMT